MEAKAKANVSLMTDDELGAWLIDMARAYYRHDAQPLVSDEVFDAAKDLLETRNPEHPALQMIGHNAAVDLAFDRNKVTLPCTMWSLDKIKADPAILVKFVKKYSTGGYLVSDKLDGISALYVCKNGKASLFTRGNGTVGHDISHFLPHLRGVPACNKKLKMNFMARCELIISKANWETIKHLGSNARNVVAGVLNAKTLNAEIVRLIDMTAYELIEPTGLTPSEQMARLLVIGFNTAQHVLITAADMTVPYLSDILVQRKTQSPFIVDGIVVASNGVHPRNVSGNPDYAFAFKSLITQDRATVVISEVEWNISKDHFAKPLAKFPKVSLNGVEIKQATLFNAAYVETHKIGPGSRVVIIRAGDVIPHIVEVLSASTSGTPSMPRNFEWSWNATHVDIIASGDIAMASIVIKELVHFFDKIDVVGVSTGMITKLAESGALSVRDIFALKVSDLLRLEGFKDKMANKVVNALDEAKKRLNPLLLMVASNAFGRGFGERRLKLIIDHVPGVINRDTPTIAVLKGIPGIETKTATAFIESLPKFWKFVDDNELAYLTRQVKVQVQVKVEEKQVKQTMLNQVVVFTGFRDADLEAYIVAAGGRIATTLSGKTTLLVFDEKGKKSQKVDKAEELGIEVMTRAALVAKFA